MTEPIKGPYYASTKPRESPMVYGLARNERGHLSNSFSASISPGWIEGEKTPHDQLVATAYLFRASPTLLAAAKKALAWWWSDDSNIRYTVTDPLWVEELRAAVYLSEGGWICMCEVVNPVTITSCRSCGLDRTAMEIEG